MRLFWLERDEDISGVSGIGRIAQGVEFDDGSCALRWLTERRSTAVYASLGDLEAIHGHDGATTVVFDERTSEPDDLHRKFLHIDPPKGATRVGA